MKKFRRKWVHEGLSDYFVFVIGSSNCFWNMVLCVHVSGTGDTAERIIGAGRIC